MTRLFCDCRPVNTRPLIANKSKYHRGYNNGADNINNNFVKKKENRFERVFLLTTGYWTISNFPRNLYVFVITFFISSFFLNGRTEEREKEERGKKDKRERRG